jgi:hypothetical protein
MTGRCPSCHHRLDTEYLADQPVGWCDPCKLVVRSASAIPDPTLPPRKDLQ